MTYTVLFAVTANLMLAAALIALSRGEFRARRGLGAVLATVFLLLFASNLVGLAREWQILSETARVLSALGLGACSAGAVILYGHSWRLKSGGHE